MEVTGLETVRILVRELVVLAALALFLELLLPRGEMRRYVKMVFGLLVIVAVIQAAARPWQGLAQDLEALSIEHFQPAASTSVEDGKRIWEEGQERSMAAYREGLSRQIKALAGMNPSVTVVDVQVGLADSEPGVPPAISEVVVVTSEQQVEVQEVKIGEPPVRDQSSSTVEQICQTIADFYGLSPDQVSVIME